MYGLRGGEECRNAQQRAINIYQHIVLVYFGKSVGIERMHRGFFLSCRQGLSVHRMFQCYCGQDGKTKYILYWFDWLSFPMLF